MHYDDAMRSTPWLLGLATVLLVSACSSNEEASPKGDVVVTISGEEHARSGFAFPPSSANDPAFVDGWDVRFERLLVTIDEVAVSEGPDTSPTDQTLTGPLLSSTRGPWAIDLTKPSTEARISPRALPFDGVDATATPLVRIAALDGARALDASTRYAFGYNVVVASDAARLVNLDTAAAADYRDMVEKGIAMLYVGTATFKGGSDCRSSLPYDFESLPKTVRFRFGFRTPVQYVNCQNTDLRGKPFDGDEFQRGIQLAPGGDTLAQITFHVDHPFWNTVDHDAPELFFDQMAARAGEDGTLTLEDLAGADLTSFKDRRGKALPWRSCLANKPPRSGVRAFDPGSVAVSPGASPEAALRHYADYASYQQSTEGHLNANGLCGVRRLFPAPR